MAKTQYPPGQIDPNIANYAPEQAAYKVALAEFQDWQNTFEPIEIQALNQVSLNRPGVLQEATREAQVGTQQTYGALEGTIGRQNRELGVNPTAGQQAASRRLMNISEATSVAGAENQARSNVRKQDQALLFGGAGNPNIASPTQ